MKQVVRWGLFSSMVVWGQAAFAQDVNGAAPRPNSNFDRDRSVTVSERKIPGYDRPGIDVGVFNLRPQLLVSAYYSDNLFATENNKASDVALTASPTLNAVADLQHTRIGLGGSAQFARFVSRGSQNTTVFDTRGTIDHDLGSGFTVSGEASYQRQAERRSDPGAVNSITPILFDIARAGGDVTWEGTKLRLVGSGSFANFSFENGRLADGTVLSQRYRDRDLTRIGGLADYALSADLALRFQVNYANSSYGTVNSLNQIDRSTDRVEILGGASFEFTDLLRGQIGIGYINQRFTNADLPGFSGFGGRAQVEYLLSPLTTFTLRASRTVEEAGLAQSPTFLRTIGTLSVDHELFRNVIVSAYGGYATDRYRLPTRTDHRPAFGASATYRMNRNVSVIARYDYLSASSDPDNSLRQFSLNSASIGLDLGF